jgi:hypothetical protein
MCNVVKETENVLRRAPKPTPPKIGGTLGGMPNIPTLSNIPAPNVEQIPSLNTPELGTMNDPGFLDLLRNTSDAVSTVGSGVGDVMSMIAGRKPQYPGSGFGEEDTAGPGIIGGIGRRTSAKLKEKRVGQGRRQSYLTNVA